MAAASGASQAPREQIPMPGCWDGLAALDRSATLESLHAAVPAAIQARDTALVAYLQERLTELVGEERGSAHGSRNRCVAGRPQLNLQEWHLLLREKQRLRP
ncbi:hypothetical protein OV208_17440 [Corallococcus sp. bb12-1]|uniref:hypothetical protein n=1 Tax=Corallococcus sp. bb12-1 TaxID=2996784 RepID=UPI00226ED50D|nr:hypothetical protein [Corallococcus sp. bb12-1]MCY1043109.1 hypothetical protein [Corallococcus sp. bb12-1]